MRKLGWRPIWTRMSTFDAPHLTAFEVTVTVSNAVVPLIVRMRKVGAGTRPPAVPERDPREMALHELRQHDQPPDTLTWPILEADTMHNSVPS
ncbi:MULTISPECIES: hypothetical protein [Burkholderia]|uniref:hypothetical protein n=2 Tax=Burkholderiaceae TaxID=119060 RepID=UPI001589851C|nr:hypothetical protein [Burkholderia ambifaria]MDN7893339.1 hypothetical protein [Burkholderia cepacia]